MDIQVSTDHNIDGHEALNSHVRLTVEEALKHFSDRITRVEVHLTDENGAKHGADDKRCVMEARLEGHQPSVVTDHAETIHQAIDGAAGKLARLIDHTISRIATQHGHRGHGVDMPLPIES